MPKGLKTRLIIETTLFLLFRSLFLFPRGGIRLTEMRLCFQYFTRYCSTVDIWKHESEAYRPVRPLSEIPSVLFLCRRGDGGGEWLRMFDAVPPHFLPQATPDNAQITRRFLDIPVVGDQSISDEGAFELFSGLM